MRVFIMIITLSLSISIAQTGTNQNNAAVENSDFDFWLGNWNLEWTAKEGEKGYGQNFITKILDGAVVQENFKTSDDSPFKGISLSVFNKKKKEWQQTWVDNKGGYLDFKGGRQDDKMILQREFVNGGQVKILQRMVFFDIEENSLMWNWEKSADEGETWETLWQIQYTRNNSE